MTSSLEIQGSCIDNNHSHFLLVDDGTEGEYGGEIAFRAKLQNCLANKEIFKGNCHKKVKVFSDSLKRNPSATSPRNSRLNRLFTMPGGRFPIVQYSALSQAHGSNWELLPSR